MLNNLDPILLFPEGQDKETFLSLLKELYLKNKSIYTLIEKFGLIWECHPLDERLNTIEILEYLDSLKININQNQKQTTNMKRSTVAAPVAAKNGAATTTGAKTNDPFVNLQEINSPSEFEDFVNFETPGDYIEGYLCGSVMIPPAAGQEKKKCFLIMDKDDNIVKCLPSNHKLTNKLNFIEQSVGGKLSVENSKPVKITFDGTIPHPQDASKTMKQFTVLG